MEEVKITIDEEGKTVVEVNGVKGPGCSALIDPFIHGAWVGGAKNTNEYYEQPKTQQVHRNTHG